MGIVVWVVFQAYHMDVSQGFGSSTMGVANIVTELFISSSEDWGYVGTCAHE